MNLPDHYLPVNRKDAAGKGQHMKGEAVSRTDENDQTDRNKTALSRGENRLGRARDAAAAVARREPLQIRILAALAERPATHTELVDQLGSAMASTNRKLSEMHTEGLVAKERDESDGRLRRYALTREGQVFLGRHRALVAPRVEPRAPITDDKRERLLRGALEAAVQVRRQSNQLEVAAERLRVVVDRAAALGAHALAVDAISELATTLRQQHDSRRVDPLLRHLEQISVGQAPESTAQTALPAFAHRAYGLGRLHVHSDRQLLTGEKNLKSAITAYHLLSEAPTYGSAAQWTCREAWSTVSLADNLRRRSQFERACIRTLDAIRMFSKVDDPYGVASGAYQAGFCLRLMGQFDGAERCLTHTLRLADEHHFERYRASALMQLGEVYRSTGRLDVAASALEDARGRAELLQLTVAHGFAQSALGALYCQRSDFGAAQAALARANDLFQLGDHREGLALNDRRRAVVERRKLAEGLGDVEVAQGYLNSARKRYARLISPAGVAACDVERGRLALLCDRSVARVITQLTGQLDRTEHRGLIEKDPWVPEVLAAFAEDAQNEALVKQTNLVVINAAEHRRTDEQTIRLEPLSALVPDGAAPSSEPADAGLSPAEMGSECRRAFSVPELVAA